MGGAGSEADRATRRAFGHHIIFQTHRRNVSASFDGKARLRCAAVVSMAERCDLEEQDEIVAAA